MSFVANLLVYLALPLLLTFLARGEILRARKLNIEMRKNYRVQYRLKSGNVLIISRDWVGDTVDEEQQCLICGQRVSCEVTFAFVVVFSECPES